MTVENLSRRQLLRGKLLTSLQSKSEQTEDFAPIRPPWSVTNEEFIAQCTRCGECLNVCETHILVKGDGDFPELNFEHGECTFCGKCVDICEQPIFRPKEETPWSYKISISTGCLTEHRIECRSCQDSCPQNAIRFRLQLGGVAKPSVALESCNGCGACVASCPTKAISIRRGIVNDNHE